MVKTEAAGNAANPDQEDHMSTATTTYTVDGMTCGCCVGKVRDKLGALPGVTEVAVDLDAATVTVTGETDRDQVAAAVELAGFRLG
ncbi:copper chaperone CopZ [Nocardia puris]|uniref:Copper chaperone CopZ n=2 Tax=Nocardia puris TaxID=208602 RepID=A0A366DNV9_9NOCA|nr:copper chaperone CopZ [Nocardia puris]